MEIKEIIMDSLHFPLDNIMSMAVYLVLGFIAALIAVLTGITRLGTAQASNTNVILALIGTILCLILSFVICGYQLDIIRTGISRSNAAPSIDVPRQTLNGVKLFVVQLVYFIIPLLLTLVCALIFRGWIVSLIGFILFVIFSFVETMGECRLAKSDDLNYALKISDAIGDMERIGVPKVVFTIFLVSIITGIISFVVVFIFGLINQDLALIVLLIISIYMVFFKNRATGLLYSDLY